MGYYMAGGYYRGGGYYQGGGFFGKAFKAIKKVANVAVPIAAAIGIPGAGALQAGMSTLNKYKGVLGAIGGNAAKASGVAPALAPAGAGVQAFPGIGYGRPRRRYRRRRRY
jgi:hypothetical protein